MLGLDSLQCSLYYSVCSVHFTGRAVLGYHKTESILLSISPYASCPNPKKNHPADDLRVRT